MLCRLVLCLAMMTAASCWAQPQATGAFRTSQPDPLWVTSGGTAFTATGADPQGQGWLRLTGTGNTAPGTVRFDGAPLEGPKGFVLSFDHVGWGSAATAPEEIAVLLFDAAGTAPPSRIALPGMVDRPQAAQRPAPARLLLVMAPHESGAGFRVTVERRDGGVWTRLADRVAVNFTAPQRMLVGLSATSGNAARIHEVRDMAVYAFVPTVVGHIFEPATIRVGQATTLTVTLESPGRPGAMLKPLRVQLPPGVRVADPAGLGGTCRGGLGARPGADAILIEQGTAVGTRPCTLLVELTAVSPGGWVSELPTGAIMTDAGMNVAPTKASLTVQ